MRTSKTMNTLTQSTHSYSYRRYLQIHAITHPYIYSCPQPDYTNIRRHTPHSQKQNQFFTILLHSHKLRSIHIHSARIHAHILSLTPYSCTHQFASPTLKHSHTHTFTLTDTHILTWQHNHTNTLEHILSPTHMQEHYS